MLRSEWTVASRNESVERGPDEPAADWRKSLTRVDVLDQPTSWVPLTPYDGNRARGVDLLWG